MHQSKDKNFFGAFSTYVVHAHADRLHACIVAAILPIQSTHGHAGAARAMLNACKRQNQSEIKAPKQRNKSETISHDFKVDMHSTVTLWHDTRGSALLPVRGTNSGTKTPDCQRDSVLNVEWW